MTIVRCPRCKDEVSLPPQATGRALVRCPLCLEEYLLAEALAHAPPPLVIIGGDVPEEVVARSTAGESEYRLAGDAGFPAADTSAPSATVVMPSRPAVRGRARSRPSPKSGLILAVNYVVGGVLGLALGLLVLWWAFRRDPLVLGPPIAQYAPWVVPSQFHGRQLGNSPTSGTAWDTDGETSQTRELGPRKPLSTGAKSSPGVPTNDAASELQTLPALDAPTTGQPGLLPAIEAPLLDPGSIRPSDAPRPDRPATPQSAAPSPDATETARAAERMQLRPPLPDLSDLFDGWAASAIAPAALENSPTISSEFVHAVDEARAALRKYEEWPKADSDGRQQAFTDLWQASAAAGRALSYLDPSAGDLTESIETLETTLLSLRGARRNGVRFLTGQQWPTLADNDGVLVAGTIQKLASAGDVYLIVIDAASRQMPLSIALVTPHNPLDRFAVGDELVAVGRVVNDPQQNVPGFVGDQARVVRMSFGVKAP